MKINKTFVVALFIGLILEILFKQLFEFSIEVNFILDLVFSFYIINRKLFLEEEQYQKEKYILNINNLMILVILYFESIFSSNLIVINIIFVFIIIFLVVNEVFPRKLNIIRISLLIIYFTCFFVIKDYVMIKFFSKYEFYISIIYIYKIVVDVFINVVLVIIFSILFKKYFKVKKKE